MTETTPTLTRAANGRAAAPVRIVHLGVGNFFRAHQAWYTEHAADAAEWGIAAFTGRSAAIADALRPQDGLYTLITRTAEGDEFEVISSLSAVHAADEYEALLGYFRSPELAIVTLTVTEAGYRRRADGSLDQNDPAVAADLAALRGSADAPVATAPARIVAGLIARRAAGVGPLAILPCDNLPGNGEALARVVGEFAVLIDPSLTAWMFDNVAFGTTMVDRITPSISEEALQAITGDTDVEDPAAVATEPFTEWVIAGDFRAGRPRWEDAGANFVDDITPHELRKLWLLNGAHSLLAYAATIKGHQTVSDAIADPIVRGWVDEWWDVAARQLPLDDAVIADYRAALLERFGNPRMRDQLSRIAADGSQKIPIRIVPALVADRKAGNSPLGAERAVAAWTLHLRGLGAPFNDARADKIADLGSGSLEDSVSKVCGFLEIDDRDSKASILALARQLQG